MKQKKQSASSKQYWMKRSTADMVHQINTTEELINRRVKKAFNQALNDIQNEVEVFYQKYADKNGMTLAAAKRRISQADFNGIDFKAISLEAAETDDRRLHEMLRELSAKGQITRLEMLTLNIQKQLMALYDDQQQTLFGHLLDTYSDSYYRGVYNVQSDLGIGWDFTKPSAEVLTKVVTQSWSGKNFSQAIWGHEKNLSSKLQDVITSALIRGQSLPKTSSLMAKELNVSFNDAKRLVRTESAYVHNQAAMDAYKDYADVERYVFSATLDFKTSPVCQDLDGKDFATDDAVVGTNFPPMHPHCRSYTVPKLLGEAVGQRIARGADSKNYFVPSNLTYKEWFAGLPEADQEEMKLQLKQAKNQSADKELHKKYKLIYGKDFSSFAKFQEIKYNDSAVWEQYKKGKQDALNQLDYRDSWKEKFSNYETRLWYKAQNKNIINVINYDKPLRDQAEQAFNLREKHKTQARLMMSDVEEARRLDATEKKYNFNDFVSRQIDKKGYTAEETYRDILKTSGKTRKSADIAAGVREDS